MFAFLGCVLVFFKIFPLGLYETELFRRIVDKPHLKKMRTKHNTKSKFSRGIKIQAIHFFFKIFKRALFAYHSK